MKRILLALTVLLVSAAAHLSSATVLFPVGDGVYVIRFAANPDYVLTLRDGNAENVNTVHLWKWKNDNSQKWKVTNQSGKIVIRSMVDENYVLDVKDYDYTNETEIIVYTFHGKDNQIWIPEMQDNGTIVLLTAGDSNYCLDLHNGEAVNDGFIKLYEAHRGEPQQWKFEKVASTSGSTQKTSNTTGSTQNTKKTTTTTSSNTIDDGVYVIRFTNNPDYVLTLKDGKAENVNIVHLWKWKNDNSQKWKVTHTDGKIVVRSMVDNDYVLDVLDYEYANNTQIIVYTFHGSDNQLWIPERLDNGAYLLKTAGDTKYCLDLYKGDAVNGGKIELYNVHKEWPEHWTFEKVSATSGSTQKTTNTTGSTQNLKPDAPETLAGYQDNVGKTYTFTVKADKNAGRVYGGKNNIYTSDSSLSAACVHAGVLKDGSVGKVTVKILADQGNFPSVTRNGITSTWRGAFQILTTNSK